MAKVIVLVENELSVLLEDGTITINQKLPFDDNVTRVYLTEKEILRIAEEVKQLRREEKLKEKKGEK